MDLSMQDLEAMKEKIDKLNLKLSVWKQDHKQSPKMYDKQSTYNRERMHFLLSP